MAGFGTGIGLFGGAVSDLYSAKGDRIQEAADNLAAQDYRAAGSIAEQNKNLSELSTQIQEAQLNRKIEKAEGATTAALGSANVSGGGSGGDIMRENIQQGALAKTILSTQGHINANAYETQALAYQGMASAAQGASDAAGAAAQGAEIGAMFKGVGGVMSIAGMF